MASEGPPPRHGPTAAAVKAGWIAWARAMRWEFFTTPTFAKPTSAAYALRAVTEWLRPLPKAYAFVGLQRGPAGGLVHVHALVGGIGRHPDVHAELRDRWRHGSLDLKGYSPLKGAVEYIVKQADDIEILGTPRSYRPR